MHLHRVLILSVGLIVLSPQSSQFGSFEGTVKTEWLADGRDMLLLADFSYIDPSGQRWDAPKGETIDGASIPRVFWSYVGGPFEGKYRNASVVHDVACRRKSKPWKEVHRMFYTASLLGGVGAAQAKVMYGAIYHYGPRWPDPHANQLQKQSQVMVSVALARTRPLSQQKTENRALTSDEDFLRMRAYILGYKGDISLQQIEGLTRDFLESAIPKVPPPVCASPNRS